MEKKNSYFFTTQDGMKFRDIDDGLEWESMLEFNKYFTEGKNKEMIGLGQFSLRINDTNELAVLVIYLMRYLKFDRSQLDKCYENFLKANEGFTVFIDRTEKKLEIQI